MYVEIINSFFDFLKCQCLCPLPLLSAFNSFQERMELVMLYSMSVSVCLAFVLSVGISLFVYQKSLIYQCLFVFTWIKIGQKEVNEFQQTTCLKICKLVSKLVMNRNYDEVREHCIHYSLSIERNGLCFHTSRRWVLRMGGRVEGNGMCQCKKESDCVVIIQLFIMFFYV